MRHRITTAALAAAVSGDLDNFIAATTPGGIEAQEAAGQATFVSNATLPKEMLHGCTREKLEQMGVKFGADMDDLFVTAQLPDGWKKQATDHSMWSDLLDEKGRKRAAIFYKGAFYDRGAHISLNRRYGVHGYEPCDGKGKPAEYGKNSHLQTVVKDCETIIRVVGIREDSDYKTGETHGEEGRAWLNANFPDWENPLAYWG
jgi:hypothetical protein